MEPSNVRAEMIDHGAIVAALHGISRSPEWPRVCRAFIEAHPVCAACTATVGLQSHHVMPFHYCILAGRHDLELDPRNLIALCETETGDLAQNHHLLLGHLDDFKSYNPSARIDAINYATLAEVAIKLNPLWLTEEHNRPQLWPDMSADERAAFRATIDAMYPAPYVAGFALNAGDVVPA